MSKYLKLFETTSQYNEYINGSDVVLPNVSVAKDAPKMVYFNPWVEPMNIITYEASAKLAETTSEYSSGLHKNAFSGKSGQLTMTSHTFKNGIGTIEFDGDVTSIGGWAFNGCKGLTSVTIPDGVTSIGNQVFGGCTGMKSITIGSNVTSIGYQAFVSCTGLTNITSLAATAPTINSYTFEYIKTNGTLTVPIGSTGYDVWMGTGDNYLGKYGWTKVEQ